MARLKNLSATVTLDLPHEVDTEAFVLYVADAIECYGATQVNETGECCLAEPPEVRKVKFRGETYDLQEEDEDDGE